MRLNGTYETDFGVLMPGVVKIFFFFFFWEGVVVITKLVESRVDVDVDWVCDFCREGE